MNSFLCVFHLLTQAQSTSIGSEMCREKLVIRSIAVCSATGLQGFVGGDWSVQFPVIVVTAPRPLRRFSRCYINSPRRFFDAVAVSTIEWMVDVRNRMPTGSLFLQQMCHLAQVQVQCTTAPAVMMTLEEDNASQKRK